MQRAMAYHSLVTVPQREQILRRNVITSHAEERRRLIGHKHLPYHSRVLAWTTKADSRGHQKERWTKFAGQHLNPFTHTPDILHKYLRSIGVLRDPYAYNLPASSSQKQWATATYKVQQLCLAVSKTIPLTAPRLTPSKLKSDRDWH